MRTCTNCNAEKSLTDFPFCEGKPRYRKRICRDCYNERARQKYQRRREYCTAWQQAYNRTDSGRLAQRRARLKARTGKASVGHSEDEWRRLLWRYCGVCAYCGELAAERDHVIPVSRGGTDFIGNILPACRACNASKSDRLLIEWKNR